MYRFVLISMFATGCAEDTKTLVEFCALPADDAPVRGAVDAQVTIVGFTDFECPYCAAASVTLDELLVANQPDVRLVFRHLPLTSIHSRAMDAAITAQCAHAQGLFWAVHDEIFAHQDRLSDSQLQVYATGAGVDLAVWQNCIDDAAPRKRINADLELAYAAGVSGTPTFFINGEPLEGAQPQSGFQSLIDVAKTKAQQSGLGPEAYYGSLVDRPCE
ncbi:MAG: hypothetical protein A2289_05225 [Deltaproteobacteria bacterium RIFOXYA12_FULL_58_15]|nr:MAG: hypothetical protein A2289_05225 [Deltaproteobacteria bacterium RIFOXYA12_FULL_58_15]OGR08575.1 MAG: hypothetical protein A2341_25560 [Deltaproteobacteria bacterium RIFOXYB12_FULL_58_9]